MDKLTVYTKDYRHKLCQINPQPGDPDCVMECMNILYFINHSVALNATYDALESTVEDYNELDVVKPKERGEDQ